MGSNPVRVLVTGASGLLGRSVLNRLQQQAYIQVTGTAFSRAGDHLIPLDLTRQEQLCQILDQVQPQMVIHCAAERWPDRCAEQPESAWQLNVDSTRTLAELCQARGTQLVYISTDYVFDGHDAPYRHDAPTNPVNFYGRSKLAGEQAVLESGDHWVLRVPWLFGPTNELHESGVTALLDTISDRTPAKIDDWAIRFPTNAEEIAEVLCQCLQQTADGNPLRGIYQWSGNTAVTRYQLALLIGEIAGRDTTHLQPHSQPTMAEPRPYNCQLDKSRLTELGICTEEPLHSQLGRILAPFI